MNYAQPILAKEGITLAFHNHYKEFITTDYGATIMDEFLEKTNINLQIDTFWAFYAGKEPVSLLEELKDRVVSIHLKDGLKDKTGKSLGLGEAPVEKVLDKAIAMGLPVVVESESEDPTGPDEVTRCFKFLETLDK
jgi:sugar phosphate isomerase/epimerase